MSKLHASLFGLRAALGVASGLSLISAACLVAPDVAAADEAQSRLISFDTDEATWMNVDTSPDGATVMFDVLGTIYTAPIEGGNATPLFKRHDWEWERGARYSPDGKSIAFLSDRSARVGGNVTNVWTCPLPPTDASACRQITTDGMIMAAGGLTHIDFDSRIYNAEGMPTWVPGESLLSFAFKPALKFGIAGDLNAHVQLVSSSEATPRKLSERLDHSLGAESLISYSASYSPDGRYAYFAGTDVRDPATWRWAPLGMTKLYKLDRATNSRVTLTQSVANRHEFAPVVSRSGRLLAYARRNAPGDTELRVQDLRTGEDRRLTALIDAEDPFRAGGGYFEELPGYAFTPDERFLVIAIAGKIHKVDVASGADSIVPISIHVERIVSEPVRFPHVLSDGPVRVRAIRWPNITRDGRRVIFSAVGSLWTASLPDGKPERLTHSRDLEYAPVLSPDGKRLAYVAYSTKGNVTPGQLRIMTLETRKIQAMGQPLSESTPYIPIWSNDGNKLAVLLGKDNRLGELGWIGVKDAVFHRIASMSERSIKRAWSHQMPLFSFSRGDRQLLFVREVRAERGSGSDRLQLVSADLEGAHLRVLAEARSGQGDEGIEAMMPSPDLQHLLVMNRMQEAYVMEAPGDSGEPPRLSTAMSSAVKISVGGAKFARWSADGTVTFSWLNDLYSYRVGRARARHLGRVELTVPRHEGHGTIAFRGARLITVSSSGDTPQVIPRGTVIIKDRRIAAVGSEESIRIPAGTRVIDARGLTLMPGLIDSHTHIGTDAPFAPPIGPLDVMNDTHDYLVYGVTTAFEAQGSRSDSSLANDELRAVSGPLDTTRLLYANIAMLNWPFASGVPDPRMAADEVSRKVAFGAGPLKYYCCNSRDQSRLHASVARAAEVGIVAHTDDTSMLLTRVADGYAVDHPNLPNPVYRDIKEFMRQSDAIWTPAAHWFSEGTDSPSAWNNRSLINELSALGPEQVRKANRYESGSLHFVGLDKVPSVPYARTRAARVGRTAASLIEAGVKVATGTDWGAALYLHFELWSLARGGASTLQAIRAATLVSAEKLGIDRDVGSLEPGKIADIVVLSANPLEKIENSLALKYTVFDGLIYDSTTGEAVDVQRISGAY